LTTGSGITVARSREDSTSQELTGRPAEADPDDARDDARRLCLRAEDPECPPTLDVLDVVDPVTAAGPVSELLLPPPHPASAAAQNVAISRVRLIPYPVRRRRGR
jgi:hypothetical protein